VEARGEVGLYGEPRLDLAVRTSAADLATLRRLFFPGSQLRVAGTAAGDVRIVGTVSSPRLIGRIEAASGRVERQAFTRASMTFAYYGQMLQVAGAQGETAGGRVSGDGWWTVGSPRFLLAAQVEGVDGAAVRRWSPGAALDIGGRLDAMVVARGHERGLTAAGSASMTRAVIGGLTLDTVEGAFRADRGALVLDRVYTRQGETWALLAGHIAPGGSLALAAHAGVVDLDRLPVDRSRLDLAGRSDFSGRIAGSWNAPEIAGTLRVSSGRVAGVAFDAASSTLALRRGRLAIGSLVARAGRARYRVAGTVEWGAQTRLGLDIEVARGSAATLTHLGGLPFSMSGVVDGRLRVEGVVARPLVRGTMSLRETVVYGQPIDDATAAFQWDGTRLRIEQAVLSRGASRMQVTGTIDRRTGFALDVASQGLALRDLALPPLGAAVDGRLDVQGRITGQPSAPLIVLSATSSDLRVNTLRFDRMEGRVHWAARTLTLDPVELRRGAEQFRITGQIGLNGSPSLALAADVTSGRLSSLLGLANVRLGLPFDGTISGRATVDGPTLNPVANLDLRITEGRFGDHPLVDGRADLTLRDGNVTIGEFFLRPRRGLIAAQGRLSLRGESQVEVDGTDLDFDLLRPLLGLRRPLLGQMNFTTQLGGTLASPEIGFALDLRQAGVAGATFDSLVANAFYRDGLLQVQQALLTQNGHKLRASGVVPFNPALRRFDTQRPTDFRLALADVNLSLLGLVTPWVREATGAVEGCACAGSTRRWRPCASICASTATRFTWRRGRRVWASVRRVWRAPPASSRSPAPRWPWSSPTTRHWCCAARICTSWPRHMSMRVSTAPCACRARSATPAGHPRSMGRCGSRMGSSRSCPRSLVRPRRRRSCSEGCDSTSGAI
jgi:autotransporter translocation and assembly factor TamB